MISNDLLDPVAAFYDGAILRHGPTAKGANWKTEESQMLRFQYLAEVIDDPKSRLITVADVGCGYGAFYDFLAMSGRAVSEYHGFDVSQRMVAMARKRLGDKSGIVIRQSPVPLDPVDYAFASGIFNVRLGQDKMAWRDLIFSTLDAMNAVVRKGFAFNLMTSHVDWKEDNLFYADPGLFLNACVERYSKRVRLLHDMSLWEWTMLVFKDG